MHDNTHLIINLSGQGNWKVKVTVWQLKKNFHLENCVLIDNNAESTVKLNLFGKSFVFVFSGI